MSVRPNRWSPYSSHGPCWMKGVNGIEKRNIRPKKQESVFFFTRVYKSHTPFKSTPEVIKIFYFLQYFNHNPLFLVFQKYVSYPNKEINLIRSWKYTWEIP